MSERRVNRIEFMKTLILVVLFFTTILFLYLLWSLDSENSFHLPSILSQEEQIEPPEVETLLIPQSVVYSQGDGSYKLAEDRLEQSFSIALSELRILSNSTNVLVSEVTAEQYKEAMGDYKSVVVSFDYGIPFNEICSRYDIKSAAGFDTIESMNAIAFSEAAKESIFIYDKAKAKYYRLLADEDSSTVSDQLFNMQSDSMISYYTIGSILGGENSVLIPLTVSSNLRSIDYYEDSKEDSESIRQALAESLFGENFDFVRRITDSFGNVTYMYGYGQKILSTSVEGVFEYKNETTEGTSAGLFGDLQTALSFVTMHGTWKSPDGEEIAFYLKDVKEIIDGKKKGYHFSFGVKIAGKEVFYESGMPIEIDILAGQVAYYRRDVISVDPQEPHNTNLRPAQDPANVIAQNYTYIYNSMVNTTLSVSSEEAFQYVAASVSSVQMGLVRLENDRTLQPAWIIRMNNGRYFYFSLYEAEPIDLSK